MAMALSTKPAAVLALALAVTCAAAWTTPPNIASQLRSSPSWGKLMATPQGPDSGGEPSVAATHLDRRDFFRSATTQAASLSLLVAASSSVVLGTADVANAVDAAATTTATAPYTKTYQPAPHSMDGKIVVITGGNAGLGLESTKRLAEAGATVVFTSRDEAKGRKALAEVDEYLRQRTAGDAAFAGRAAVVSLDLCDLDNVKSFSKRLASAIGKDAKVDVLMNNAGVMAIPDRRLTKDGYERTFQTNHLGHFALTSTLLPSLSPDARVINVSSTGYQFAAKGLDLDNLNGEKEFGPWSSYGLSKLENILFTNELQKRARQSGAWSNLTAFSVHPGAVQTELARYLIGEEKFQSMKENGFSSWKDKVVMEGMAKFIKTVQEGASTQVFLAATDSGSLEPGKFFSDGKVTSVQAFATDAGKAEELWAVSEKLSGVKFEL